MSRHGQHTSSPEEPDSASETTSWLPVLLGVVCTVGLVAVLFGSVYLKAGGL